MQYLQREIKYRDLGDLITETASIYGRNFLRLIAISAVIQIPLTLASIALLNIADVAERYDILLVILLPEATMIGLIIVGYSLMIGALIHATCQQHLQDPINISDAYNFAWKKIGNLTGANLLVILAIGFIASVCILISLAFRDALGWPASLGAIVPIGLLGSLGVILLATRWLFVTQSIILEDQQAIKSLSRSTDLVSRSWWQIFGTALLFSIIVGLASAVIYSPFILLASAGANITVIGITLILILATPIIAVVITLMYYNQRKKKGEFDVKIMAQELELESWEPSRIIED